MDICVSVLIRVHRRMLQFNQGKKTKKVLGLRRDAEKTFITQLDMAVDKVTASEHLHDVAVNQGKAHIDTVLCIAHLDSSDFTRYHCFLCWQMHHSNPL